MYKYLFSQIYKIKIIILVYFLLHTLVHICTHKHTYVFTNTINLQRKCLLVTLNQGSHKSVRPRTADFVHYQVPLVSLPLALSDLPFAVALRTLAEHYTEVAAVKSLIAISIAYHYY